MFDSPYNRRVNITNPPRSSRWEQSGRLLRSARVTRGVIHRVIHRVMRKTCAESAHSGVKLENIGKGQKTTKKSMAREPKKCCNSGAAMVSCTHQNDKTGMPADPAQPGGNEWSERPPPRQVCPHSGTFIKER